MLTSAAVGVVALTSLALFAYGLNMLFLSWRSFRGVPPPTDPIRPGEEPLVAVQLPIYNERYVAERIIDAAARIDWPRERLHIQVLDDSDDDTEAIVAARVARWRRRGLRIDHVRRPDRTGYKAGALAHGLELTGATLLAVFDADFVPRPDFLRRLAGELRDPEVGFVQARWGHLNEGYSWITRLQALSIDFHFLVEQAARSGSGYLTNFTGTAGIWRREAIAAAGGWSARTLTEDLDLSYRAQLAGWKAIFLEDVVVPEELPVAVDAYRRQQSRWATGSFQCAFLLAVPVLRSRLPVAVKWQAMVHLFSYSVPLLMLAQVACYPLLLLGRHGGLAAVHLPLAINLISLAPSIAFTAAQVRRGRPWWHGAPGLICQVIGAGLSVTVWTSFLRALRPGGEFRRTPKYRIEKSGQEWRDAAYTSAGDPMALVELAFGLAALTLSAAALAGGEPLMAAYSGLIGAGFLYLGSASLVQALEVMTIRRLGLRALVRLRAALPMVALLAAPAALLLALAQWPDPFEDSFQHWLLAANLVTTGHLADPLFGMEDTWLPGYTFLAAAVLRVAGWHDLAALKLANVVLAVLTLAVLSRLAPTPRQGRLAILLLALNPIFLLTATSAVAEPLILLAVTAASAAVLARRYALAASWTVVACLTGTKAWLWLFCALAAMGASALLARSGRRAPQRLAWAMPAIAILALFQLGAGEATHSVARAAQEVGSAVARGDLNPNPGGRALEFAGYFLLASLPLAVLAPLGLRVYLRPDTLPRLRLLVLPGLLYLGVLTLLVFAGIYSGSHRYYYLGLPGLALLAAAGLDRHSRSLGAGAAAAAGLVAVAFLPVFASFSAIDRGLVAAGREAATQPGALLTDSPVAAYYSGKRPAQIVGSRRLPSDPLRATGWLQDHRVTTVVSEDIPYYRLSSVFPGLASGTAPPPFQPLGDQAAYNLPGGKTAHVYTLPERFCAWVTPTAKADLNPADQPNLGKTAGLEKGLVLETTAGSLAGEGMGFGVPIVEYPDGWVYSASATTADLSTAESQTWVKVFDLDLVGGDAAHGYRFVSIPSRGRVEVTYRVGPGSVDISVSVLQLDPGYRQVGILNEESSAFDDFADPTKTLVSTSFGRWEDATGDWARLRSASAGLEFSLPQLAGAQLHAGREQAGNLDWAGLDYLFGADFKGTDYRIEVRPAR